MPVLDLLHGEVVRGVAGQRQSYRPLVSPLVGSSHPRRVAEGLRELVGHPWLYVADLDAIQDQQPHGELVDSLSSAGFRLIVDAGLRDVSRARSLREMGVEIVVAALETLPSRNVLEGLVESNGPQRTFFSLDLMRGRPLGELESWESENPISIGTSAVKTGVGGVIVLDLVGVGVGEGVSTQAVCAQLSTSDWNGRIVTGGGVRDVRDVHNLLANGVDSVLVASALHDGRISAADLGSLENR